MADDTFFSEFSDTSPHPPSDFFNQPRTHNNPFSPTPAFQQSAQRPQDQQQGLSPQAYQSPGEVNISEPQGSSPFAARTKPQPASFIQRSPSQQTYENEEEEPPLLEDLGIDLEIIRKKSLGVLTMRHIDHDLLVNNPDLAGPIAVVILFAVLLLFQQKLHFGYVYGFVFCGSTLLFALFHLMSRTRLTFYHTFSVLGYSMIPLLFFTLPAIFLDLRNLLGFVLGILSVGWCSITAVKFFQILTEMHHRRYLIGYPVALFYTCFFIFTIF